MGAYVSANITQPAPPQDARCSGRNARLVAMTGTVNEALASVLDNGDNGQHSPRDDATATDETTFSQLLQGVACRPHRSLSVHTCSARPLQAPLFPCGGGLQRLTSPVVALHDASIPSQLICLQDLRS